MVKMEKRLGFIGIILKNRKESADAVNHLLSEYGSVIVARTGVPYKEKEVSVISLIIDATSDELGALTGKLGTIQGISVKSGLHKK